MTDLANTGLRCEDAFAFLSAYLDGELDPLLRERFDAHLADCPDCVSYTSSFGATVAIVRDLPAPPPPPDLEAKILDFLCRERARNGNVRET